MLAAALTSVAVSLLQVLVAWYASQARVPFEHYKRAFAELFALKSMNEVRYMHRCLGQVRDSHQHSCARTHAASGNSSNGVLRCVQGFTCLEAVPFVNSFRRGVLRERYRGVVWIETAAVVPSTCIRNVVSFCGS